MGRGRFAALFVAKTDTERRVVINTVGPVWEGNQVWFILGGGAIFAAWPPLLCGQLLWLLLGDVRVSGRADPATCRVQVSLQAALGAVAQRWDWALFIGGAVPALLFGVAVGNVLLGAPLPADRELFSLYEGTFFQLLHPFALAGWCGVAVHAGCAWRNLAGREGRIPDYLGARPSHSGFWAGVVAIAGYALARLWLAFAITGFQMVGQVVTDGPSNR